MFAEIDEARKTLDRVDALLFQAETGQIQITAEQWDAWETQGNALVGWLSEVLSPLTSKGKQEVVADLTKIRSLNHIQMTMERYQQLRPEAGAEADAFIKRMFDPDNPIPDEEVEREWSQFFGFMFVERPRTKRGFFKRLLGR